MKKYIYIILLVVIHLSCEQRELTENDNFGFDVMISVQNQGFLLEKNDIDLEILPDRIVDDEKYTFSFLIDSGSGNLFYDTKIVASNEKVELGSMTPKFNYIPNTVGDHEITVVIENKGGLQSKKNIKFTIAEPFFRVKGSFLDDSIFKDQKTDINFDLIKSSQIDSEQTFQMKYIMNSGNASILASDNKILKHNVYYDINPESFHWIFEAIEVGKIDVSFFVKNNKGTEVEIKLLMTVLETDYNFSASPIVPTSAAGRPVQINYLINNLGEENLIYTMKYTSDKIGVLEYKGIEYAPNVPIPVTEGAFFAVYTATNEGEVNLVFEVEASNGLKRDTDVKIDFKSFDFTITYDNSRGYVYYQEIDFDITINSSISDTYTMKYLESNDSQIVLEGMQYAQNESIVLNEDQFTVSLRYPGSDGNIIGNKKITFVITSSSGKEIRKTANIAIVDHRMDIIGLTGFTHTVNYRTNDNRVLERTIRVESNLPGEIVMRLSSNSSNQKPAIQGCLDLVHSILLINNETREVHDLRINPTIALNQGIDYTLRVVVDPATCVSPVSLGSYAYQLRFSSEYDTSFRYFDIIAYGPV